MRWRCRDRTFDLSRRTLVMGIVNITPDSFSDGGRFLEPDRAIEHAHRLVQEGADLVDLGAESSRPGSVAVEPDLQLERLMPVLEALVPDGISVSVDTASARVAESVLAAGARAINDITALGDPAMGAVVAQAGAGLVLMHMQGTPATMQDEPRYEDAASEIQGWLAARVDQARRAGVAEDSIAIDPGIGFGKTLRHNLELLARIDELRALGRPVMVGASRKSFIQKLLDLPVDQRLEASLSAAAVAVFLGARIVRTHDVRSTVRAVRLADAMREARRPQNVGERPII
jgi:dihydropteroate synthase